MVRLFHAPASLLSLLVAPTFGLPQSSYRLIFQKAGLLLAWSILHLAELAAQNSNPFTAPVFFVEGSNVSEQLEVADLDGDGHDDVVNLSNLRYIVWFKTDVRGKVTKKTVINSEPLQYYHLTLGNWLIGFNGGRPP